MDKKTLCVDFDGVIHSYESGWQGGHVVTDPPVDGAMEWLGEMVEHFEVCIYSSRSKTAEGRMAMFDWLKHHIEDEFNEPYASEILRALKFPAQKPAAFLTIDDRAFCFEGVFPSKGKILSFKPWNKRQ